MNTKLTPRLRFPEFRDAGEWEVKFLGEISKISTGSSNREDSTSASGAYTFFDRSQEIRTSDIYLFDGEAVIVAGEGQEFIPKYFCGKFDLHQRTYAIMDFQLSFGLYLFYYIYQFRAYFLKQAVGSTVKSLRLPMFQKMAIALPSLNEQQKIADCLSSLDELITAQTQKIEALKLHKKGLMQKLFPAEGKTVPELRFPEFHGTWDAYTLKDIAQITSGGTPNRAEPDFWNGSIPWVTTSLIDFNTIDNAEEFITVEGLSNSSARLFPKNTLLMAMYGQGKTRGKVALLGIEATTNQACAAIMLNKEVDVGFVFQNLASRYDEIRKLSNEGGQENLSAGLIKMIKLTLPSIAEQQKIADCLSSLDDLITAQVQKIEALKLHKKGLMQGLFPNDEVTL
ncbi:restriction endonuclease subunit S [Hydromonas duriensis]|uniref:Type I restriction enzyme S subunit n=1 Tax=Hydromonas duriensis TaxID=1527608 RepID=A0A4R6Y2D8_9BURK|nr:restriction endonuclease subunit S [Hydromonas duriensis]TDR30673.1 type I restriction enzyme S subunit [Hydromonas duriensis]